MRISDWSSDVCSSDLRRNDANLELARQIAEFGVKAGRLTQQLGPGARVADFVGGGARILVGGNVADAFAAGLDRVHLDRRQLGEDVGRILQLDPVILDILARREMAVARSEEHTSEPQSLIRNSSAGVCLKKKRK